jgi:hypothetical protein
MPAGVVKVKASGAQSQAHAVQLLRVEVAVEVAAGLARF